MVLELVREGVFGLEQAVEKLCHAPARLFGVRERGYLSEGYLADLVLIDLDQRERVEREQVLYKCGWSPLEGMTLNSRIRKTFVNGELRYDEGRFQGGPNGRRLAFG